MAKSKGTALDPPVIITVTSYRHAKHDQDGVSAKAAIDGIVQAGILPDDSRDEVEEVRFRSVKVTSKTKEKTIIEIEEI